MSHVSFDLCSIFDIENNWNGVLEQSGKPRQKEAEEEEALGGEKEEDYKEVDLEREVEQIN